MMSIAILNNIRYKKSRFNKGLVTQGLQKKVNEGIVVLSGFNDATITGSTFLPFPH